MKRFVQLVCVILVLATVMAMPVFAAETADQRASNYFVKSGAYFNVVSSTKFEIWFDVSAVGIMDELGASTIELYRSTDMENWTPVKTYKKANYSQMIGEGVGRYANCVPYTFTSGYYYYADVTVYAKKGNGTAESSVLTSIIDLT